MTYEVKLMNKTFIAHHSSFPLPIRYTITNLEIENIKKKILTINNINLAGIRLCGFSNNSAKNGCSMFIFSVGGDH